MDSFQQVTRQNVLHHDDENHMSESDDSFGFSDTENHDENEDANVADTTSDHDDMEEVNNRKNQDAFGASSENFTSADLTDGYNAIFNLQYLILPVNYP